MQALLEEFRQLPDYRKNKVGYTHLGEILFLSLLAVNNIGKRKLDMLHAAFIENDLRIPPSNRFEHLQGNLKGFCNIRINEQFRVIFRFENSNAYDVYIEDYHK
ncbi:type II toxin-antitoxin system RelE/ParE family toxin [Sulfurimonas hydrogeniphila]|uniref:type II toxin-antitoxin system RelE/ParE family toxin n=1 Tax=Sulfurimonas hydrogeniphila TaxID=2509341 RepID=UPI00125F684C|nr:type II toxin-antitoxin system RelE/ParE family toxin [Sulfurimonas hydrogeniphila]